MLHNARLLKPLNPSCFYTYLSNNKWTFQNNIFFHDGKSDPINSLHRSIELEPFYMQLRLFEINRNENFISTHDSCILFRRLYSNFLSFINKIRKQTTHFHTMAFVIHDFLHKMEHGMYLLEYSMKRKIWVNHQFPKEFERVRETIPIRKKQEVIEEAESFCNRHLQTKSSIPFSKNHPYICRGEDNQVPLDFFFYLQLLRLFRPQNDYFSHHMQVVHKK
jgi:hypothetical protein